MKGQARQPELPGVRGSKDRCEPNRSRRKVPWIRSIAAGLAVVVVFLALGSCNDAKHHEMTTFFFDGVPPLAGQTSGAGPFDANATDAGQSAPAGGWYVHAAIKNCPDCHGARQRTSFSRKVNLVAQVPNLCYKCHEEFASLKGWVHGPVATGDCLTCHEPHKTKNEFVLLSPIPDLCYKCHLPESIQKIEHHAEPSYSHCIDCHAGHASASRSLLSPAFLRRPAGAAYLSQVQQRQYEQSLQQAKSDLTQSRDFLTLLRTATEHVETDQLGQARAYLEVILNSGLLTESEKPLLAEILQQVISLQTPGAAHEPTAEQLVAALRQLQQQRSEQERALADLYYRSIKAYRAGRLTEARQGFLKLRDGGPLLGPVKDTVQSYLERIESSLKDRSEPSDVR